LRVLEMAAEDIPYDGPIVTRAEACALGLKRYFSGRLCIVGHVAQRYLSGACVECDRLRLRHHDPEKRKASALASYYRHRDVRTAKSKLRRAQNLERYREQGRKYQSGYRAKFPNKVAEQQAAYRSTRRSEASARTSAWRLLNKERAKESIARWRKMNAEANKQHSRTSTSNRRARLKNVEGVHTVTDIKQLFYSQKGYCAACQTTLEGGFHVDHMEPISRGGSNWPSNLQLLCAPCNQTKGAKSWDDWQAYLLFSQKV